MEAGLFRTFEKCQGKSHFITPANATCFGHHFESGELNTGSIFSGKKDRSDRSYGAGENSEAEERRFPLGSNPAALSQSDIFYRLSDKIHGNCKAPSLSMPRALGRWTQPMPEDQSPYNASKLVFMSAVSAF